MDLGELDVAEASDKGAPLTLLHPATGEPGDAVLMIRGYDSDVVIAAGRAADKSFLGKKEIDLNDALATRKLAMAKAASVSVEGLTIGNKKVDRDQLIGLLDRPGLSWIVDQITEFGSERQNFFPKPQQD